MLRRNRNWVVLRREGGEGSNLWRQFTASYAPTRQAAIDMAIANGSNPLSYGVFRAVPAKEWGPEYERDEPL